MNIVIDAFGGDNAPLEVIKGSIDAQKDFGVDVTLVGDEEKIKNVHRKTDLISQLYISSTLILLSRYVKSLQKSSKARRIAQWL